MRRGSYQTTELENNGRECSFIWPSHHNRTSGPAEVVLRYDSATFQRRDFAGVAEARSYARQKLAEFYRGGWREVDSAAARAVLDQSWALVEWEIWHEEAEAPGNVAGNPDRAIEVAGRRVWCARGKFQGVPPLRTGQEFRLSNYGGSSVDGTFVVTSVVNEVQMEGPTFTIVHAQAIPGQYHSEPQRLWTPELDNTVRAEHLWSQMPPASIASASQMPPSREDIEEADEVMEGNFRLGGESIREESVVSIPADGDAVAPVQGPAIRQLDSEEVRAWANEVMDGRSLSDLADILRANTFTSMEVSRELRRVLALISELGGRQARPVRPDRAGAPEPRGLFREVDQQPDSKGPEVLGEQERLIDLDE
jgi:hypothetical protein